MPLVEIPGFKQWNTSSNPRTIDQFDVTVAYNVKWEGNRLVTRDGSTLWKNDDQADWGRIARFKTYKKRDDNFFYVVVILTSGRVFAITSDDANYGTPSATWTEVYSPISTSPALEPDATRYELFVFNNVLYLADSTNNYFSWDGLSADLTVEANPPSLSTNNIVAFQDKSNRLVALDDGGLTHLSAVNDGSDFTTVSGGGVLNYGRVEGLVATSISPFADDLVITTEDPLSVKFQAYRLLGIQFFDPAVTGSDTSQFEVRKISSEASIIGESAQEITGDTIGLTVRGFVKLSSVAENANNITERSFISFPIKELIPQINFQAADKIRSAVDINGRYYCAVPFGEGATEANVIFVYDYLRSSPGEGIHRWALWAFNSFSDIGTIGIIQGQLYVTDLFGNIYKANDPDAGYADQDANGNDTAINYVVRTAAIGGANIATEKEFGDVSFLLTDLTDDFSLTFLPVIENLVRDEDIDESPLRDLEIELPLGGLTYDTPGLLYDDLLVYDSGGSDQKVVSSTNRGGRANSMQWQWATNTTGVSWGIGSFSVNIEVMELTNASGGNNSGDI